MFTIQADCEISRRKRLHVVLDEHDTTQWTGPTIVDAFVWLYENGHQQVEIQNDKNKFAIRFEPAKM